VSIVIGLEQSLGSNTRKQEVGTIRGNKMGRVIVNIR